MVGVLTSGTVASSDQDHDFPYEAAKSCAALADVTAADQEVMVRILQTGRYAESNWPVVLVCNHPWSCVTWQLEKTRNVTGSTYAISAWQSKSNIEFLNKHCVFPQRDEVNTGASTGYTRQDSMLFRSCCHSAAQVHWS